MTPVPTTSTGPLVAVYADESCLGNGRDGENPGGAGVLIEYRRPSTGVVSRFDVWVSEAATTNNRMALRSVIEAFRALSAKGKRLRVVFTTDSRYIVDGMTAWVHDWARRGWRRKTGTIENLELWQAAVREVGAHDVAWRWVRGHAGHAQNEYANHLATRAAAELSSSNGLQPSAFDTWLTGHGAKAPMEPEPFPELSGFRAAARLPTMSAARPSLGGTAPSAPEEP
jgi:ribonuclease HI